MTQWVGQAVEDVSSGSEKKKAIQKFFLKTGCLITVYKQHDDDIFTNDIILFLF